VGDILDGPAKDAPTSSASGSPSPGSPSPGIPPATKTPAVKPSAAGVSKPTPASSAGGTADEANGTHGKPVGDPAGDAVKDAIKDAAHQSGATVKELDEDAKGLEARKDDDIPAGAQAKEPFPCPTPDPQALADAREEPGIPLLADDPWTLRSSVLTLRGLEYHGIVQVRTSQGLKPVLKFTTEEVDIQDLHQTAVYPEGRTHHDQARAGSTSTIRNGPVTMYVQELTGNLFGLIPITFSPTAPPPVDIPAAVFTDVTVIQAGQFGGTLTIPGLQDYITD
jgi:hypothetical protein